MASIVRFPIQSLYASPLLGVSVFSERQSNFPTRSQRLIPFSSVFWHQTLRQILTHPASFFTYDVSKLAKGTLAARYLNIFLVFLLSGILHTIAEYAGGLALQYSGTLRFFCTQVLGIIMEDSVEFIFRTTRPAALNISSPLWARLIGYTWVISFLFWSTPAWLYPQASAGPQEKFLPFSIVTKFTKK